jgi:hypothetical protein
LACLRNVPASLLVNNSTDTAGVIIDNIQLTDTPLHLFRNGKFNRNAPLLGGVNAEEGNVLTLLTEGFPPMAEQQVRPNNHSSH